MAEQKFDARFTISLKTDDPTPITDELLKLVAKQLQKELNEERVLRKVERHFELSAIAETKAEVTGLTVVPKT